VWCFKFGSAWRLEKCKPFASREDCYTTPTSHFCTTDYRIVHCARATIGKCTKMPKLGHLAFEWSAVLLRSQHVDSGSGIARRVRCVRSRAGAVRYGPRAHTDRVPRRPQLVRCRASPLWFPRDVEDEEEGRTANGCP
jgi:hypothetical protein